MVFGSESDKVGVMARTMRVLNSSAKLSDSHIRAAARGAEQGSESDTDEDEFSDSAYDPDVANEGEDKAVADEHHVGKRYLTHAFGPSWGTIVAHRPKIDITDEPESWHVRFDNGLDCYLTRSELDELKRTQGTPKQCPRECRMKFVHFVEWKWFDRVILSVILINCICLALTSPVLEEGSTMSTVLNGFDTAFAVIFLSEMILKILALNYKYFCTFKRGGALGWCIHPNMWNLLDFVISIEGGIGLLIMFIKVAFPDWDSGNGGLNLTFLRTLRVFRPLRTITHLPGLKALVEALALSLPLLRDALILIFFFFIVFGYMGLELWMGLFRVRCFDIDSGLEVEPHLFNACSLNNVYVFGAPVGRDCPAGQFCGVSRENFNYGVTSFDNIFVAFITIFQCITLEGWADIMYISMDVFSPATVIYFVLLLIFGTFVLLNLLLAVVVSKFGQCKRDMEMQQNKHRTRRLALDTLPVLDQMKLRQFWTRGTDDVEREVDKRATALGKELMKRKRKADQLLGANAAKSARGGIVRTRRKAVHSHDQDAQMQTSALFATNVVKQQQDGTADAQKGFVGRILANIGAKRDQSKASSLNVVGMGTIELHPAAMTLVADNIFTRREDALYVSQAATFLENDFLPAHKQTPIAENEDEDASSGDDAEEEREMTSTEMAEKEAADEVAERLHKLDMQREQLSRNFLEWWCFLIVQNKIFTASIYLCICGNTVVLALDLYPAPVWYENTLNWANLIFTLIFTVEMVIRILATGISAYVSDRFNILDGSVTIAGLIELLLDEDTGVVAFRAARFLRLARLVRYMKSLQEIVSVIQNSLVSVLYVFLLLALFLFIFAIFGMQSFGGAFAKFQDGLPRNNFDNFHISFVTVFQILAGENWPAIMYDCVRARGIVAVLYFIIWVVLGQFILLNLFLAVLMDNFDKIGGHKEKEVSDVDDEHLLESLVAHANPSEDDDWCMRRLKESRGRKHCCIPKNWRIVRAADKLITYPIESKTKWFDQFIMVIIIISSVMMAVEGQSFGDPETTRTVERSFLIADIVFTALFTVEVFIKVVAMGFCCHKGAYLRDNWNVMDFVVVFTSLLNLGFQGLSSYIVTSDEESADAFFSALSVLRMARTLRPLRVVNRNPNLRIVIEALALSIKPLFNVAIVLFLVWFMFALVGVQLMAGKFFSCNDPSFPEGMTRLGSPTEGIPPCSASWTPPGQTTSIPLTFIDSDGISVVRQWADKDINFNHIVNAIIALYIMATGEGWPNIMFTAMDVTQIDFQPKRDESWFLAYYFVLFITVTVFFFLELVIGAIFQNFINLKRENNSVVLTDAQRRWVDKQKELRKDKPHRPTFPDELRCCRGKTAAYDAWLERKKGRAAEKDAEAIFLEVETPHAMVQIIELPALPPGPRAQMGYASFHNIGDHVAVEMDDVIQSEAGIYGWAKYYDSRKENKELLNSPMDDAAARELDRLDGLRGYARYHGLRIGDVANHDVTVTDDPKEWRRWAVYFGSAVDPRAVKKRSIASLASSGRRKSMVRARPSRAPLGLPIHSETSESPTDADGEDEDKDESPPSKPDCYECITKLTWMREKVYTTVTDLTFDLVIVALILTNMAVMCCVWYEMTHFQNALVQYANYCFVAIFTLEVIVKTIAMGPKMYLGLPDGCCCQKKPMPVDHRALGNGSTTSQSESSEGEEDADIEAKLSNTLGSRIARKCGCNNCDVHCTVDGWNLFDVIVVSFSIIDVIITVFNTSVLRALRLAKIMRIAKLIRTAKMARLIKCVQKCCILPALDGGFNTHTSPASIFLSHPCADF